MRIENHVPYSPYFALPLQEGWNADLNKLFGEGTIIQCQVARWFKKFKLGDTNFADEKGRGRPSNFDNLALLAAVKEDKSLTTTMLTIDFNMDNSTIVRRLKKLGKEWKLARWIAHELSEYQQSRTCLNFHRFAAAKRAYSVLEESRHWRWIVASLQKRQKNGLRFARCFTQRNA